jgi:hypothetical protein
MKEFRKQEENICRNRCKPEFWKSGIRNRTKEKKNNNVIKIL